MHSFRILISKRCCYGTRPKNGVGTRYSPYSPPPGAKEVYTVKKLETVRPSAPKYPESEKPRPAPSRASRGFRNFVGFTQLGPQNRPTIPSLKIAIITYWLLGQIVLVFKAGYHFRLYFRMQSCIQLRAGVSKRLLPCKLS